MAQAYSNDKIVGVANNHPPINAHPNPDIKSPYPAKLAVYTAKTRFNTQIILKHIQELTWKIKSVIAIAKLSLRVVRSMIRACFRLSNQYAATTHKLAPTLAALVMRIMLYDEPSTEF